MTDNRLPRYLHRIRNWCLKQPGTIEVHQWGCKVFKVRGKVYAICGLERPLTITLKPHRENLDAYLYHPAIAIAKYVGRFGWVTITVADKDTAALALSVVEESYRLFGAKGRRGGRR